MPVTISHTDSQSEFEAIATLLEHLPPQRTILYAGAGETLYEQLCQFRDENRPHVRLTWTEGKLEIVSPRFSHEDNAAILRLLILVLCAEFGLRVKSAGSTTIRSPLVGRGLEPDESFSIQHVDFILNRREGVPPPDLAVEVESTQTILDRLPVYAALKVPELWRYCQDGQLEVCVLQESGEYGIVRESPHFPGIPATELAACVAWGRTRDDNELINSFRLRVRKWRGPS
ncbi:MAG: Uma2 family endonuclease [Bacteroidales bacterium]|nr:Uma2 family endonuclease [Bacteroidales bacterium]